MLSGIASPCGSAGSGGGSVTVTTSPELTRCAGSRIVRAAIVDLAVEDQRLQPRARQRRDARGQHAVEPPPASSAAMVTVSIAPSVMSHVGSPMSDDKPLDPASRARHRQSAPADADRQRDHLRRDRASCSSSSAIAFSTPRGSAPAAPDVTAALPAGAKVMSTAVGDGHIVVTIEVDGAIELRSFDLDTLKPLGGCGSNLSVIRARKRRARSERICVESSALDLLQHRQQIADEFLRVLAHREMPEALHDRRLRRRCAWRLSSVPSLVQE